jgi:hypothetical protein
MRVVKTVLKVFYFLSHEKTKYIKTDFLVISNFY